jgi:hypothetical protein
MGHDDQQITTLDTFGGTAGALTIDDVRAHGQLIQQVLRTVMKDGVHYGTIPGTKGKSLWKPGAELILTTFRLGTVPETIEETGQGYRVTIRVFHIPTGNTVGYGVGSCSFAEDKYAWRRAVNANEYESAAPANKRVKHYANGGTANQVRTNPADYENTVLKMAVKRARVDACLACTAASDAFEQDLETVPVDELKREAQRNGNENGGSSGEPAVQVDEAKLLVGIESAKNVDELVLVFDQINDIRNAKQKVSLMGAYKVRLKELGPEAVEG